MRLLKSLCILSNNIVHYLTFMLEHTLLPRSMFTEPRQLCFLRAGTDLQTFTTSPSDLHYFTVTTLPVKGFTSEVQLTQERNLYQKATVKQFTSEVNRPSLPSLFHHGVHFFHCSYTMSNERIKPVGSPYQ